jgi:hypothetical protein
VGGPLPACKMSNAWSEKARMMWVAGGSKELVLGFLFLKNSVFQTMPKHGIHDWSFSIGLVTYAISSRIGPVAYAICSQIKSVA